MGRGKKDQGCESRGLTGERTLAKGLAEPYAPTGSPPILEDGEWVDRLTPQGHPLRGRFSEVRTRWLGPLYARQKEMLDAIHARQGVETSVASCSAVRREDGGITSYCVWGKGVDGLLPEADKVVCMEGGGKPSALAGWARVREVVGHPMEPTEHYPARYRVRAFPDAAALAELGIEEL